MRKEVDPTDFKVTSKVSLKNIPTFYDLDTDEDKIKDELDDVREDLADWHEVLYAYGKYAVLICLQGMDTAGKDSLIREVFQEFNARGLIVHSFKVPSARELRHDYLWRHYIALPERGEFGIFNRTHYENVLVTRVHPEYILGENIPGIESVDDINDQFWDNRFQQINNFEKNIAENGTIIFKFFLNISKDEQRHRQLRRLNKEEKNWKFSPGDLKERELWDQYLDCYENAINNTSKEDAPWYIIPSDDKDTARYLVAKIMYEKLSKYKDVKVPELAPDIKNNIEMYKKQLKQD